MDAPDPIIVTPVFHALVEALGDRLGPHIALADTRWRAFADALDSGAQRSTGAPTRVVSSSVSPDVAVLVVGPPALVVRHARHADREFGFVMPVARSARRWQRVTRWRDDATMTLWRVGWSPVAIDRLVVADEVGSFEFVIGNARPTPTVAAHNPLTEQPAAESALDNGD